MTRPVKWTLGIAWFVAVTLLTSSIVAQSVAGLPPSLGEHVDAIVEALRWTVGVLVTAIGAALVLVWRLARWGLTRITEEANDRVEALESRLATQRQEMSDRVAGAVAGLEKRLTAMWSEIEARQATEHTELQAQLDRRFSSIERALQDIGPRLTDARERLATLEGAHRAMAGRHLVRAGDVAPSDPANGGGD